MLSSDRVGKRDAWINVMIALLPFYLLFLAAALTWMLRKRAVRVQWGLSAILGLLIWIATLTLRLGPDQYVQISAWQPSQMFQSPLSLAVDPITWPVIYAVVTLLVAMILTSASREPAPTTGIRVFWFLYTGSAVIAILANNLLTVIITWTLFDFISAIFLFSLLQSEIEIRQVFTRLSIDIFGVLLVLAGTAFSLPTVEGISLTEPITSALGIFLIMLGGFVRLGLFPLHFNLPSLLEFRRGLGSLMRLYPPAIVLAFLAKLFQAGIPPEILPWLYIAGISSLVIGGLRWILASDALIGRPFFILAVCGVGVIASTSAPENYMGIASAAIVLLLAGAVLSLTEIFTPSHRFLALGAVIVQLGLPILPAGILGGIAGSQVVQPWPGLLVSMGIMLGISLTALGSLQVYYAPEISWRTGENLSRLSYGLGIALPILSSVGLGIHLRSEFDLWSWVMLGVQFVLIASGFFFFRSLPEGELGRFRIRISRLDPSNLYFLTGRGLNMLQAGFRSIAGLIEGEAAILWIFAITVFLILATG